MRITTRKESSRNRSLLAGPYGVDVCINGRAVIDVRSHNGGGWYWYGLNHNTLWRKSDQYWQNIEDAIADAKRWIRSERSV